MRNRLARTILSSFIGVVVFSSGCLTLNAPSGIVKSLQKSKIQESEYNEEITVVPSKLKNPNHLKLKYALWMEEMNQLVEARAKYEEVADSDPTNVEAVLGLARIDQTTGQNAESERKYKKAIRMAPESSAAHLGLGQFYLAQEDWQKAVGPLTDAMLAAPSNASYRFQLAVALVHAGDIDSALPHFIRTVGDAEAHYNVAMILKDRERVDEAEKHFLLAVTKKPEFDEAVYWLSQLRQQRRRQEVTPQVGGGLQKPTPFVPDYRPASKPAHSFSKVESGILPPQRMARRDLAQLQYRTSTAMQ